MKLVIFAGGSGTRLWPLSRENSPKQFDKIFGGKSTLELAVERVAPSFGMANIFIQAQEKYKQAIIEQIPGLPRANIIIEPERRNVGPAVCFAMVELKKRDFSGPVAILWADHLMESVAEFIRALKTGEKLIEQNPKRFIFIAEKSRFANNNLGWIKIGEKLGTIDKNDYFILAGFKYRPPIDDCVSMHESENHFWNPGYWITSIDYLLEQYKNLAPEIYRQVINDEYGKTEPLHFDQAIAEKIDFKDALVLTTDMGWSDPGTLYALKEALEVNHGENVIHGKVTHLDTCDSLIYNLEPDKLVATVGLKGMVIVNTPDALIVVPKDEVVKITKLIEQMKQEGHHSHL